MATGQNGPYRALPSGPAASAGGQGGRYAPLPRPRQWKNECYQCCGECDGLGWGVCCATFWCFPCTFGYLKYKAFGSVCRGVAWTALFILICGVMSTISYWKDDTPGTRSGTSDPRTYIPLALLVLLAILGACNRCQLRWKFKIEENDNPLCDFCMWFWCNACALCQETRTMIYNNVEQGEWRGPEGMVAVPPQAQRINPILPAV